MGHTHTKKKISVVYLKLNSNLTGHLAFLFGKPGHSPWSPTPGPSGVTVSQLLPGAGSTLKDIGAQSTVQILEEKGTKANVWAPERRGHIWGDLYILTYILLWCHSRTISAPLQLCSWPFVVSLSLIWRREFLSHRIITWIKWKKHKSVITQRLTQGRRTTNVYCVLNEILQPQNDCIPTVPVTTPRPIYGGSQEAGTGATCDSTIMHNVSGNWVSAGVPFRGTMRALAFYTLGAGGQAYRMLLFLLRYIRHTILCTVKVYNTLIWYSYIL